MGSPDFTEVVTARPPGSQAALDRLFPLLYEDLRARAHRLLEAQPAGHTLSTTALVHESYLKLVRSKRLTVHDRAHFLALAAHAMRLVLVSYARSHAAAKRGGGAVPVELDPELALSSDRAARMLELDEALDRLARLNERLSRNVELRFFGGLTVEETAEVMGVAQSTVKLDWQKARAWLYRELGDR
jgi:RNA polymerase sigma factor (TIGR02999 family)